MASFDELTNQRQAFKSCFYYSDNPHDRWCTLRTFDVNTNWIFILYFGSLIAHRYHRNSLSPKKVLVETLVVFCILSNQVKVLRFILHWNSWHTFNSLGFTLSPYVYFECNVSWNCSIIINTPKYAEKKYFTHLIDAVNRNAFQKYAAKKKLIKTAR